MEYRFVKSVNIAVLKEEIQNSSIGGLNLDVSIEGDSLIKVNSAFPLTAQQEEKLKSIIITHIPPLPYQFAVKDRVLNAMEFGRFLMADFAARNILLNYSVKEIQTILAKTLHIKMALEAGSLYVAMDLIKAYPADEFITEETKTVYVKKIQVYLRIV